ncbi:hypothetical protein [Clostridium butyricum]|uniref:hypothetical protein n=1 Tax=Clostridium butyricum TaxID=1492 RepID=UPI0018AADBFF|nr:hypothetical protein [Clostridium butyricum]
MKFDLKNSKLLFEVRFRNKNYKDIYTYEMLYKRNDGKYFIHFDGGKYSEYRMKIGYNDTVGRSGNYFINPIDMESWKAFGVRNQKKYPEEYMFIDWEKEEDEATIDEIKDNNKLIIMGALTESEMPF